MKKFLAVLLIFAMVFCFAACGGGDTNSGEDEPAADTDTVYKVGMVCIGDDNAAYDRNFMMAADEAKKRHATAQAEHGGDHRKENREHHAIRRPRKSAPRHWSDAPFQCQTHKNEGGTDEKSFCKSVFYEESE